MKSSKLFKNLTIYFGSQMITALLPVIIIPIISRSISLSEYGEYSLYKTIYAFLIPLIGVSFSNAVMRKYYVIDKDNFKPYMFTLMVLISCMSVIIYFILKLNEQNLLIILKVTNSSILFYALYVVYFTCISAIILAYYRAINHTKKYFLSNLIGIVSTLAGILILKNQNTLNLDSILKIHLISIILVFAFNLYTFFQEKFKLKLDFSNITDTLKYCLPLVLYAILAQIYGSSDRFIINYYLGKDYVGLYSAGVQMAFVIPMIGQSIQLAWTPYVFERLTLNNVSATKKLKKITLLLVVFLIFLTIAYAGIYPFIFRAFLPVSYDSILNFYLLFIIAGLFQSLYWLYNPFLLFHEKNSYFIYITIITAISSLILNFLFVSDGLLYVAVTFALSWLIQFVLLLITISYVKNIKNTQ